MTLVLNVHYTRARLALLQIVCKYKAQETKKLGYSAQQVEVLARAARDLAVT